MFYQIRAIHNPVRTQKLTGTSVHRVHAQWHKDPTTATLSDNHSFMLDAIISGSDFFRPSTMRLNTPIKIVLVSTSITLASLLAHIKI